MPLLDIKDLCVEFDAGDTPVRAVDGVSLSVNAGETVCLVGESGSGKTVTALSIARLLPCPPARIRRGEIWLAGRNILELPPGELRSIRGGLVAFVFQEPAAAMNPVTRVGDQVLEMLRRHRPEAASAAEVARLLGLTGIASPEHRARDYPHQMSGGMLQRVMIAMAIAAEPKLLVADEPTTALDVTIQAQILDLLRDLRQRLGMSILLITHHLGIVAEFADRVAVMYAGQIVEQGPVVELLARPRHPYTRALIEAVPRLGQTGDRLETIPGNVPAAGRYPQGCRFHPRCAFAVPACGASEPVLEPLRGGRLVRCARWRELPGEFPWPEGDPQGP